MPAPGGSGEDSQGIDKKRAPGRDVIAVIISKLKGKALRRDDFLEISATPSVPGQEPVPGGTLLGD